MYVLHFVCYWTLEFPSGYIKYLSIAIYLVGPLTLWGSRFRVHHGPTFIFCHSVSFKLHSCSCAQPNLKGC